MKKYKLGKQVSTGPGNFAKGGVKAYQNGGKVDKVEIKAEGGSTRRMPSDGSALWRSGDMSYEDMKKLYRNEPDQRKGLKMAETAGSMDYSEFMDKLDAKYPRATKALKGED